MLPAFTTPQQRTIFAIADSVNPHLPAGRRIPFARFERRSAMLPPAPRRPLSP